MARLARRHVRVLEIATHVRPVVRVAQGSIRFVDAEVPQRVMSQPEEVFTDVRNAGNEQARADVKQSVLLVKADSSAVVAESLAPWILVVSTADRLEPGRARRDAKGSGDGGGGESQKKLRYRCRWGLRACGWREYWRQHDGAGGKTTPAASRLTS